MKKKDHIAILEKALKKFWKDYGKSKPVKGVHTEIVVEPRFFIEGKINPEVAELLVSVYLSNSTYDDVEKGKISISSGVMTINNKYGYPIATIHNQKIIKDFKSQLAD